MTIRFFYLDTVLREAGSGLLLFAMPFAAL